MSRPIEVVVLNAWVTETKRDATRVEHLDDLGEVDQRSGQPVDLVDHHDVYLGRAYVSQKSLQARAVECPSRPATVIIGCWHGLPAFVSLAHNEGFASLALRLKRIKLLLQALFRGLARINRAT